MRISAPSRRSKRPHQIRRASSLPPSKNPGDADSNGSHESEGCAIEWQIQRANEATSKSPDTQGSISLTSKQIDHCGNVYFEPEIPGSKPALIQRPSSWGPSNDNQWIGTQYQDPPLQDSFENASYAFPTVQRKNDIGTLTYLSERTAERMMTACEVRIMKPCAGPITPGWTVCKP